MTAHDDRARDEQPAPGGCGCQYDAGGRVYTDRCVCPEQPAPAGREIPADELARAHEGGQDR